MQRFQYIVLLFFLVGTLPAQTLIEKFRSQSVAPQSINQRDLIDRSRLWAQNDFNMDGYPEVIYRDSLFFRFYSVPDQEEFVFSIPASLGIPEIPIWALYDVDGIAPLELIVVTCAQCESDQPERTGHVLSLNMNENTATITNTLPNIIGFFDVDGDELVDLIQYDRDNRELIVSGVAVTDGLQPETGETGTWRSASTYAIDLKYESGSMEQTRLPYLPGAFQRQDDWDLNGDGVNEIVLTQLDSTGAAMGLRVINGRNQNTRFTLPFPEGNDDIRSGFRGFYDVDGVNGKEIYLGNRTVIDLDQNVYHLPEHFIPFGFADIDQDSLPDIIGRDTMRQRVQIWGAMTTTSLTPTLTQAMGFTLLPAYPNPMSDVVTIPVHLQQPARLTLTVHDLTGRQLDLLRDEQLPPGEYQFEWSRPDLPGGVYFYRLRVGEQMVTRKLIKE